MAGLAAFVAFIISTIAGGGGALILVPTATALLGPTAAPPVVTVGNMLSRPVRLILFWKHTDWEIVRWYLPFALLGAGLGAYVFTELQSSTFQVVLGIILMSMVLQYRFGKKARTFRVRLWYFAPLGFGVALLSALLGAAGPLLNPFFLNYGTLKERMIATKAVNSFFVDFIKIGTYASFGAMTPELWYYGLAVGIGGGAGTWLGKRFLAHLSDRRFRQLVVWMMFAAGVVLLLKGLGLW